MCTCQQRFPANLIQLGNNFSSCRSFEFQIPRLKMLRSCNSNQNQLWFVWIGSNWEEWLLNDISFFVISLRTKQTTQSFLEASTTAGAAALKHRWLLSGGCSPAVKAQQTINGLFMHAQRALRRPPTDGSVSGAGAVLGHGASRPRLRSATARWLRLCARVLLPYLALPPN